MIDITKWSDNTTTINIGKHELGLLLLFAMRGIKFSEGYPLTTQSENLKDIYDFLYSSAIESTFEF